ncbi:hypothetical protein [Sphingomonas sp. URHD0057]|uniref:hypothetical protein n=1 Tax=Sphingomonas sp. URHD0057 TaxID=1380389 RepID=UPI0012DE7115|nr:hypothetical protein [Sphingomonas sp. URHD0057]
MSQGPAYALMTFCAGLIVLLGWFYAMVDNPRAGAMIKTSFLLFALPILFVPGDTIISKLGMLALVAWEEILKAFASTREKEPLDRFRLVSLFGVWELVLDKPIWALLNSQSITGWSTPGILVLVYATALPVLMHTVTAAAYAFRFDRHLWAAFLFSFAVHSVFNATVDYFGVSLIAVAAETLILLAVLATVVKLLGFPLASQRSR